MRRPVLPPGTGTFAFLFEADHPALQGRARYSDPCEQELLGALVGKDELFPSPTLILRGDIGIRELASRTTSLEQPAQRANKKYKLGLTRTVSVSRRAMSVAIGDLVETIADRWHTIDLLEAPWLLGNRNIYCLALHPISVAAADAVSAHLAGLEYYLGAVHVDTANPNHATVFLNSMAECAFLHRGRLTLSIWPDGQGADEFGFDPEVYFQVSVVPYEEFQEQAPARPPHEFVSERGALSARRMATVLQTGSHLDQLAEALQAQGRSDQRFRLRVDFPDGEQVVVPDSKLTKYALDPNSESPDARSKAKLFEEVLGIKKSDWRFLAWQLQRALSGGTLERVGPSKYGIQYRASLQVLGINGLTRTVETGWIVRDDEPAQLVTTYIAERKNQRGVPDVPPLSVAGLFGVRDYCSRTSASCFA